MEAHVHVTATDRHRHLTSRFQTNVTGNLTHSSFSGLFVLGVRHTDVVDNFPRTGRR